MNHYLDSNEPIYPDISVKLIGHSSNAFFIIGTICAALKKGGVEKEKIEQFTTEAQSGDFDNVLRTAMKWVEVS